MFTINKPKSLVFLKIIDKLIYNSHFRVIQRVRLLEKRMDIFLKVSGLLDEERIKNIFSMLETKLNSFPKNLIRLGSKNDGGYVLVEKIFEDSLLVSLGIGDNLDFELDWIKRGGRVVAFDGTISKIPKKFLSAMNNEKNFIWVKKNVCMQGDNESLSINKAIDLAREYFPKSDKNSMLKIDIESSEWDAITEISKDNLRIFDQLIVELHNLISLAFSDNQKLKLSLSKLHDNFELIWVHENNFSPRFMSKSHVMFDVVETTWINKHSEVIIYESNEKAHPAHLNAPNDPKFPNY